MKSQGIRFSDQFVLLSICLQRSHMLRVPEFLILSKAHNIPFMYIPHLLTHSSINGLLGCFYILAIVNKAINIGVLNALILTHKGESIQEYFDHNIAFGYSHARVQVVYETPRECVMGTWQESELGASATFQPQRCSSEYLPHRAGRRIQGSN